MWSADEFKKLLTQVTNERELNGFIDQFIQKIIPIKADNFIILGNLKGAFHSLVRDLDEFINRKYLDHYLTIINPNIYIVFNGNVVDGSAYILETLTILLVLMRKNPEHVIYLRGPLENKEHWINGCLPRELAIKAAHESKEPIPLFSVLNRFFNTLPLALYLLDNTEQKTKDIIRIAPWPKDFSELNEGNFSDFLTDKQLGLSTFRLQEKPNKKNNVSLKALILNELLDIGYEKTTGLQVAGKEKGLTAWTLLSSPIGPHRNLYDFYYDAYAVLSTKDSIKSWTIKLCNRDVRDTLGFTCGQAFNVITGFEEKEERKPINKCVEEANLKKQLEELKAELSQLKKMPKPLKPFD